MCTLVCFFVKSPISSIKVDDFADVKVVKNSSLKAYQVALGFFLRAEQFLRVIVVVLLTDATSVDDVVVVLVVGALESGPTRRSCPATFDRSENVVTLHLCPRRGRHIVVAVTYLVLCWCRPLSVISWSPEGLGWRPRAFRVGPIQ